MPAESPTAARSESTEPGVFVVIPVHNRRELTRRVLECLSGQTWSRLSVIVVDDGSTDGTAEMIEADFPDVVLLRGDGSLWWTAAVNMGVRRALGEASEQDYVLVLNDDLEVRQDFVDHLLRFASEHPRSLVGSVCVDIADGDRIDDGGVVINWWTAKHDFRNRGTRLSSLPPDYAVRASYLTGRGTLIPVAAFREVGLYDERHFLMCGDTELPVRAARRGFDLRVTYGAVVHSHVEASAEENKQERYTLSMLRRYYFGIKSNTRLKYRFHFALAGAGPNPVRLLSYLAFDLARITAHFARGLVDL